MTPNIGERGAVITGIGQSDVGRRLFRNPLDLTLDACLDAIADAYCAATPERQPIARAYLRENLRFALDDRAAEGLRTYYREAAGLGLVSERRQAVVTAEDYREAEFDGAGV